jgi:hypothetical protein
MEKGVAMCILQIQALCDKSFSEILPEEIERTELTVEDGMGQILLKLFDGGVVDEVTICFASNLGLGFQDCSIQIRAQSSCHSFTLFPRTEEHMKLAIAQSLGALLRELFVSVRIASVTLSCIPRECENCFSLKVVSEGLP